MRSSVPSQLQSSKQSYTVERGGRSLGIARHWQPVLRMYISPFTTSRTFTVRLLPPRLPGRMSGSPWLHSSSSNRSDTAVCCGRTAHGSRSSTSATSPRLRPPRAAYPCITNARSHSICSRTGSQGKTALSQGDPITARVLVVDDIHPNVKLLEAKLTAEYF